MPATERVSEPGLVSVLGRASASERVSASERTSPAPAAAPSNYFVQVEALGDREKLSLNNTCCRSLTEQDIYADRTPTALDADLVVSHKLEFLISIAHDLEPHLGWVEG